MQAEDTAPLAANELWANACRAASVGTPPNKGRTKAMIATITTTAIPPPRIPYLWLLSRLLNFSIASSIAFPVLEPTDPCAELLRSFSFLLGSAAFAVEGVSLSGSGCWLCSALLFETWFGSRVDDPSSWRQSPVVCACCWILVPHSGQNNAPSSTFFPHSGQNMGIPFACSFFELCPAMDGIDNLTGLMLRVDAGIRIVRSCRADLGNQIPDVICFLFLKNH